MAKRKSGGTGRMFYEKQLKQKAESHLKPGGVINRITYKCSLLVNKANPKEEIKVEGVDYVPSQPGALDECEVMGSIVWNTLDAVKKDTGLYIDAMAIVVEITGWEVV